MSKKFNVEEILQQLTLDEKISLLAGRDFWHTVPVKRLNIPSIRTSDGPNGVRGTVFFNGVKSACFPCGTALASTFNKELLNESGKLMGEEAKHKGAHILLGPTTNMQRGPLGGRGFESFSEDPYLAGMVSAAIVNGVQSQNVAATIKHYVGNDLEHERNASDSIVTPRAMREIYLEPFRLAVKHANPKAFMTGYNKVNGEHVSQSKFYIEEVLRKEWNWNGLVMSDWFGTYTTKTAIENGLDLEMPGPSRFRTQAAVGHMIQTRELHINDLDARVRNVLEIIKYSLDSGIPEDCPEDDKNNTEETAKLLREVAGESIVLLKNEGILPLKKTEKIAVIGPNAKIAAYCGGGSASLRAYYTVTPYEGITKKLGQEPPYTAGAYGHKSLPDVARITKNPVTGETGFNMKFFHEPHTEKSRTQFDEVNIDTSQAFLADYYHKDLKGNLFWADIEGEFDVEESGEYEFGLTVWGTAQLFVNNKLVVDNTKDQVGGTAFFNLGTIEQKGTIKLEKGTKNKLRVEFSSAPTSTIKTGDSVDFGGGGAVSFGFARVVDPKEEIAKAVELAKSVDKVVLSIGLTQEWESEGFDRPNMDLPGYTNDLVSAVLEANPNTVVVNQSGTPVEFPWLSKAKALVHAWFGGNETGNAIADVLFGDVNPSGKLGLSWPLRVQDNPTFLNFRTEKGRVLYGEDVFIGYRYYEKLQKQVAFPFGYGLSYTKFEYSDLKVTADDKEIKVSATIKNTGDIDGAEAVQVYIAPKSSSINRPVKELKEFTKLQIKLGKLATASFTLSLKDSISYFDEYQNAWCAEKGNYEVHVGPSSDDIELIAEFTVKETKYWHGL